MDIVTAWEGGNMTIIELTQFARWLIVNTAGRGGIDYAAAITNSLDPAIVPVYTKS